MVKGMTALIIFIILLLGSLVGALVYSFKQQDKYLRDHHCKATGYMQNKGVVYTCGPEKEER